MHTRSKQLIVFPLAVVLSIAACNAQSKYASYEDCVLENLRGSASEAAVLTVREVCRTKFPPSKEELAAEQAAIDEASVAAEQAQREADATLAPLLKEQREAEAAAQFAAKAAAAAIEAAENAAGD